MRENKKKKFKLACKNLMKKGYSFDFFASEISLWTFGKNFGNTPKARRASKYLKSPLMYIFF